MNRLLLHAWMLILVMSAALSYGAYVYLQRLSFWNIEEHDWRLQLGDRTLHFRLTPYMHFPGAYVSFDDATGVLFSSDIFGGFTEQWRLYAEDEQYFESVRAFHEHYMPSREIVQHGLSSLESWPIRMIAPQHGSIIRENLVHFMFRKLKALDCGLYLMAKSDTSIHRLMAINHMLRESLKVFVLYRDFRDIVHHLLPALAKSLPVESIEFYVAEKDRSVLYLAPSNRYRGTEIEAPSFLAEAFAAAEQSHPLKHCSLADHVVYLPLGAGSSQWRALAVLKLADDAQVTPDVDEALGQISGPLMVAIEREVIYRNIERERDELYLRSIRDPLTGLYTRYYMHDAVERMLDSHDRGVIAGVTLVMMDVDHFKQINDTYGHATGDMVLEALGRSLLAACRKVDVPVRIGGEEFAAFIISRTQRDGMQFAERLRRHFEQQHFDCDGHRFKVTLSAGVAEHQKNEGLQDLIRRADAALYAAKESGRNKVVCYDPNMSQEAGR